MVKLIKVFLKFVELTSQLTFVQSELFHLFFLQFDEFLMDTLLSCKLLNMALFIIIDRFSLYKLVW